MGNDNANVQGYGIDLIIELDGSKAILSLNDNGKKKEWLLTGYKIDPVYKSQKKHKMKSARLVLTLTLRNTGLRFGVPRWLLVL